MLIFFVTTATISFIARMTLLILEGYLKMSQKEKQKKLLNKHQSNKLNTTISTKKALEDLAGYVIMNYDTEIKKIKNKNK